MTERKLRIGVYGIDHNHIYGQVNELLATGRAEIVCWGTHDDTPEHTCKIFQDGYPDAPRLERAAIMEDESLDVILTAAKPCDRADIAIDAMRHGHDVMTDKPGCTTLAQLDAIQKTVQETGKIWSVHFSERLSQPSCTLADKLIADGRIGDVVQTVGLGPHRLNAHLRPDWFFERDKYGGILCDIAAHQFDQFLHFTGSTSAKVVNASVANVGNPQYPGLQDFGDVVLEGDKGRGYARVDWFTPDGLPNWGDGRMTILGTKGFIELRKYVDIAGREGTDHVFVSDQDKTEYLNAGDAGLPFAGNFIDDVFNRTETAETQAHMFLATRLGLEAQNLGEDSSK